MRKSKNIVTGAAVVFTMVGLAAVSGRADETVAQAPPAPPAAPPAAPGAPPPAGAPAAPGAPAPAAAAAPTSPLIGPSITGPLTIQLPPPKYTLPLIGDVYFDGIGSGLFQWQNNPFAGNRATQADLSNGQFFLQKTDGIFQFYTQFGAYAIGGFGSPVHLGGPGHLRLRRRPGQWQFVGVVPGGLRQDRADRQLLDRRRQIADPDRRRIHAFASLENINIERGLLWNQEPAISKGGQANLTLGPVALSLSVNDGFDSGVYNWVTGAAIWTINSANSFDVRRRRQSRENHGLDLAHAAAAEQLVSFRSDLHLQQ